MEVESFVGIGESDTLAGFFGVFYSRNAGFTWCTDCYGGALAGILDYFEDFLYLTALVYPAIAGVMFADFFFLREQTWKNIERWNYMATIATVIGIVSGYYTQYVNAWGVPALQSLIAAFISYYLLMWIKSKIKPDEFTPEKWLKNN